MRNRNNKLEGQNGSLNTIGAGTSVKGDISSKGDLRIDGDIEGNLTSSARVVIGSKAIVLGDINATNAIIEGTVKGNVSVKEVLALKATALIDGDIAMTKLMVENGAVFNGKSQMNGGSANTPVTNETKK